MWVMLLPLLYSFDLELSLLQAWSDTFILGYQGQVVSTDLFRTTLKIL